MMDHEHREPIREPEDRGSLTGFAAIKYGFIFLIVIAVLYFLAAYVLPAFTD
jgi:hypothetical protein